MTILWQDLGYGLRMVRKKPGTPLLVILVLTLGQGSAIRMALFKRR